MADLAQRWSAPDLRSDVAAWAKDRVDIDLWSMQRDIAASVRVNDRTYVRSCHDSGKTFLAAVVACHHIDTHPVGQARVISTAPTNDQVVGLLWTEINQIFEKAAAKGKPLPGRVTQNEWWIGSYQAGVGRKPGEYKGVNFQGYHSLYPLVIVDEADAINAALWSALGTLLTNDNAKLFGIGNPDDPTSYFRKLQETGGDGVKVFRISAWDTPNFSGEKVTPYVRGVLLGKKWVDERRLLWGGPDAAADPTMPVDHPMWASKVEAEYPEENALTIVRLADVIRCQAVDPEEREAFGTVALGIDVAGSEHGDEAVVRERIGRRAMRRWGLRSSDPEAVENFFVECAQISGASQITIDATGIGFGFIAGLRRRLPNVAIIPFNFGAGATDKEQFLNARAELYWNMRVLSRDQNWDLSRMEHSEETVSQLVAVRRVPDAKKIQVEDKNDIKRRIGRSPDDADALGLAFWSGRYGGTASVSTAAGIQLPTGSAAVTRGVGAGTIPVGAAGLTRGPL